MIRAGITGWPLRETLSPAMHSKGFRECSIEGSYEAFPCKNAGSIISEAAKRGIECFNVTIPHKAAIIPFLDEISPEAAMTGSVNAVKKEGGILKGSNFDAAGFEESFSTLAKISGGSFIIAGCGGSASSIAYVLCRKGASSITVSARTPSKAEPLAEKMQGMFPKTEISISGWNGFSGKAEVISGIINCSPCGMKGYDASSRIIIPDKINPECAVFDLVYTPYETSLTLQAKQKGLKYKNGLEMLVIQGLYSFRYFTGRSFDSASMTTYLRSLL